MIKFHELFRNASYEGIAKMIGKSSAQSVLFHAKFEVYSNEPGKLHDCLIDMLGPLGTVLLEKSVIREMFEQMNEPMTHESCLSGDSFEFVKSVEYIRKLYARKKITQQSLV